jgi:hypothetical protein
MLLFVLAFASAALALGVDEQWSVVQIIAGLAILTVVAVIGYRMIVRALLAVE